MKLYIVLLHAQRLRAVSVDVDEALAPTELAVTFAQSDVQHLFVLADTRDQAEGQALQQARRRFAAEEGWGRFTAVVTELPPTMEIDGHRVTWQVDPAMTGTSEQTLHHQPHGHTRGQGTSSWVDDEGLAGEV